jgi:hypothetical protein
MKGKALLTSKEHQIIFGNSNFFQHFLNEFSSKYFGSKQNFVVEFDEKNNFYRN